MNRKFLQGYESLIDESKEKDYIIKITLNYTNFVSADNKRDAKKIIKDMYKNNYNIDLKDEEIKIEQYK